MRNSSSSSESDSDYTDNIPEPKVPVPGVNNLEVGKAAKDKKRPSMQFIEQLNLTEQDLKEMDVGKKIVPIYFGTDENIVK